MSKRSDEHDLRRYLAAQDLNRRAGGDINKILPALDDMLKEAADKRKKEEQENDNIEFNW